ncbi:hypothetical protein D3C72_1096790 [compost metagenome]
MPSRFIFSLRFYSKTFVKFAVLAVTMVFFMTLFRANLFFLSVFHAVQNLDMTEVLHSFIAGLRFDLLVVGFIMIPITLLILIQAFLEKWPSWLFVFYRVYLATFWVIICSVTYADFFFFARNGRRMRLEEYKNWNLDLLKDQMMSVQQNNTHLVFSIITVMLLILGLSLIFGLKFGAWKDEYSPRKGGFGEIVFRILVPLILVALAARGTVEPHHLALEHSEVSNNTVINEMALNAPWCFDK